MDQSKSISASALDQFAVRQEQKNPRDELGQSQFLELMITQIKHQDPLNPAESGEFLSQLAQFGTVNGITELQSSFDVLASTLQSSQALQASTMVGRTVMVPGNIGLMEPDSPLQGAVALPASSGDVKVHIEDATGQLVRQISLGAQPSGNAYFTWDGFSDDGQAVPPGTYRVTALAMVDGQNVTQDTLIRAKVESVTLGQTGSESLLNLRGLGTVLINDVKEIQ